MAHILEGSVRKAGNQLRITAQLIKADNGFHLWSDTFDRQLEDVFSIQDDIASAVTRALEITLNTGEFDRPGMTRNVAAYELYMKGRENLGFGGREETLDSIRYLEQASAQDPDFGLAWIALIQAYTWASIIMPVEVILKQEYADINSQLEAILVQAESVAPEMQDLVIVRQNRLRANEHDYAQAEGMLLTLLETSNTAEANLAYGEFLLSVGQAARALTYIQRAQRLDPLNLEVNMTLISALSSNGQGEQALATVDRALEVIDSTRLHGHRALAAFSMGETDIGFDSLRAWATNNPERIPLTGQLQAGQIQPDLVRNWLLPIIETGQLESVPERTMGSLIANVIGAPELAVEALIFNDADYMLPTLHIWQPIASDMRKTARFSELLVKSGKVDYWRSTGNWGDFCRPLSGSDTDFECF